METTNGHPEYLHSFSAFTLADQHEFNITGKLTDEGVGFIQRHVDQPFFLWLNYQDPHPAFCCPKPYDTMYDPEQITLSKRVTDYDKERQPIKNEVFRVHSEMNLCKEEDLRRAIAHYMGQISYVDDSVGRVMDTLKATDRQRKTVVLFFSDHGELLGDYGMTHKNPTFYDCLTRIPTILVHPDGRWQQDVFSGLTEEVDLVPTLLEMLGVAIPPTMIGKSWFADLNAKQDAGKPNILCEAGGGCPTYPAQIEGCVLTAPHASTSFGVGAMLREGSYKLSIYGDDICELYDLQTDPDELCNLYDRPGYETVQANMTLALLKRTMSVKVRDVGLDWDYPNYPHDVRFEPLENTGAVLSDVRASGEYGK